MKKNRIWSKLNQQVHNLFLLLLEYQKLINKKKIMFFVYRARVEHFSDLFPLEEP
jgi:hypothetical protein